MTLRKLRDGLKRTRPCLWGRVSGWRPCQRPTPCPAKDAHRHQEAVDELLRRPCL